jgi:hypothetical protein
LRKVLQDDNESAGVLARQYVRLAQACAQATCGLAQQLVCGFVPECMADLIEAIKVDRKYRQCH